METFFRGKNLDVMSLRQREHWVRYHGGLDSLLYTMGGVSGCNPKRMESQAEPGRKVRRNLTKA